MVERLSFEVHLCAGVTLRGILDWHSKGRGKNVKRDVYKGYDASWLSPARALYGLARYIASTKLDWCKEMRAKENDRLGSSTI